MNVVELHALRIFGRHGVHPDEQEQGQGTGAGRGGADLKSELVVVFVRSDPEPSYYIAFA